MTQVAGRLRLASPRSASQQPLLQAAQRVHPAVAHLRQPALPSQEKALSLPASRAPPPPRTWQCGQLALEEVAERLARRVVVRAVAVDKVHGHIQHVIHVAAWRKSSCTEMSDSEEHTVHGHIQHVAAGRQGEKVCVKQVQRSVHQATAQCMAPASCYMTHKHAM